VEGSLAKWPRSVRVFATWLDQCQKATHTTLSLFHAGVRSDAFACAARLWTRRGGSREAQAVCRAAGCKASGGLGRAINSHSARYSPVRSAPVFGLRFEKSLPVSDPPAIADGSDFARGATHSDRRRACRKAAPPAINAVKLGWLRDPC